MPEETQRRLTTIVAADIAGFSRLVGADEEGTLAAQRGHRRELIEPLLGEYHGRIANTAGDSFLFEFPSAVEAVRCSIAIQDGMAGRNSDVPPDLRIEYRIGINVGDVVADGDDLLGDGVNIAARLESICEPGGIILSDNAYQQVRDRLDIHWRDGGEHEVKNIARPVQIWRWGTGAGERNLPPEAGSLPLPDKPSIAVLPFDNMSGDPEQEYFSDGLTEDIITELSRFHDFMVIARNTTFTYKGRAIDVKAVSRELNARYVIEGSVRKAGNRLRVSAQLIDGQSGAHLWAERYDRDLTDIFAVQDDVTAAIVSAVAPRSQDAEMRRALRLAPMDLNAWDILARARHLFGQDSKDRWEEAVSLLRGAIERYPDVAPLFTLLGNILGWQITFGWSGSLDDALREANDLVGKALKLDPADVAGHTALAGIRNRQGRPDEALIAAENAIRLNPNSADAHAVLSTIHGAAGRHDRSRHYLEHALELSPFDTARPRWFAGAVLGEFSQGHYEDVVRFCNESIDISPEFPTPYRQRAAALGMMGRLEEAKKDIAVLLRLLPSATLKETRERVPLNPEAMETFIEGLRRVGLPED